MGGFQAISAANGWVMAVTGGCIVFIGLALLSLVISQLYRVLAFVENGFSLRTTGDTADAEAPAPADHQTVPAKKEPEIEIPPAPKFCPQDLGEAAELYKPFAEALGQPFALTELHKLARKHDYPHPHITISCLREGGYLVNAGDGQFSFKAAATDAAQPSPVQTLVQPAAPAPQPVAPPPAAAASLAPAPAAPQAAAAPPEPAAPAPPPSAEPPAQPATDGTSITAPMPGMIVRYEKKVGDVVDEGETVVVLEAMKMENALPAPVSGTIKATNFGSGDSVAKGDVMCVIG